MAQNSTLDRAEIASVGDLRDLDDPHAGTLLAPSPRPPPDQSPARVYIASLGARSQRTMRLALETIAAIATDACANIDSCPWHLLRFQHTTALRARLALRYKPATANRHLAALRGTLKAAWRLELISPDGYQRAVDFKPAPGSALPAGRSLSRGELRALFAECAADSKPTGARDAALIALLYGSGLRRSEVVAIDMSDYDIDAGSIRIRNAKGGKDRMVYCARGADAAIDAWLTQRGSSPGPMFWPTTKGGKLLARRMTCQTVLDTLQKRAKRAKVKAFSPHDMRRTFIGDMLDAGADIVAVQQLAGHASPNTTSRYDRRGERAKKSASSLLHVPFVA